MFALRLRARALPTVPRFFNSSAISSSSVGHDSHSHSSPSSDEYTVEESFSAPIWRNSVLAALALVLFYRLNPSGPVDEDAVHPLTNYLSYHMPTTGLWKERNAKHLDLAKIAADDKLLFQEAERPKVRRMRFTGSFEQASPNGIVVGSQVDLSDLKIKSEKDDFAEE